MTHNINTFMNDFLTQFYNLVRTLLGQMKGIEFWGTDLLTFVITIAILSIVIPILLVLPGKQIRAQGERRK